jgi:riboflavin-specific deaminase-like protein
VELRRQDRSPEDRPFVFVNMISTLDGRAARDGRSATLGGDADLELLLGLRAVADAVLIGTGTLRAEGYARLVRNPERRARRRAAGMADDPLAVLITRGFEIPWEAGLFQAPEQPVLICTGAEGEPPGVPAPVEVVHMQQPTLAGLLGELRSRGIRSLLCEAGPTLHGALQREGLVDELFLTVAPLLTGDPDEPAIVAGGRLPAAVDLRLEAVLRHGSELFLRYAV